MKLTLLLTLLLAAPTALAGWKSFGSYEPDTALDESGGFMFVDPNTKTVEKLYLNVVPVFGHLPRNPARPNDPIGPWVNPNVGALGSRLYPAGPMQFDAMFGTWIDCNLDTYIGHAESVLFEYPSQLLPAGSPCANAPMYNQQGWVSEMRWIQNPFATPNSYAGFDGNNDGVPDGRDGRAIRDLGATIWGDFGVPGDTMGREVCPREPTRGTTQRTGALMNWADCFTAHRLWESGNMALAPLGLGFSQKNNFDEAGHPLNAHTLGADDRGQTMAQVWDCDTPREKVNTGQRGVSTQSHNVTHPLSPEPVTLPWFDITDADGNVNVTMWQAGTYSGEWRRSAFRINAIGFTAQDIAPEQPRPVAAGSPNPGGSVAGTYNHTVYNPAQAGDCDGTDSSAYGTVETGAVPEKASEKNRVTIRFEYYEEQRNGIRQQGMPFYGTFLYPGVRGNAAVLMSGTHWYGETNTPSELGSQGPTTPQLVRSDNLQPEGAIYWTFYANLTAESLGRNLQLPPAAPGIYGSEWCSRSSDPAKNGGFVCDGSKWYLTPDGTPSPGTSFHPRPGHAYHLRDVDCYDGTLARGLPARASLADLRENGTCVDAAN